MANMRSCRGHRVSILASARLFVILGAIGCSGTMSSNPGSGSAGAAGNGGRAGGPSGAGGASGSSATGDAGSGSEGGAAGNGGRAGGPSGAGGTSGSGVTVGAGGGGGNGGAAGGGTGGTSAGAGGFAGRGGAGSGGAGRGGAGAGGSGGAGRGGAGGSSSGGAGGRGGSGGGGGSAGNSSGPEPFVFGVPPSATSHFKKGINLGNRLEAPNEGDWGGVVQAEDFPFIARRGFDHVRIPIRFSGHALTASPYTIDATFFSRVDTVLNQAAAANLAVVVDMHAYDELAADVTANRDRFVALWTQIAARYQSRPDTVAFELLNEPNGRGAC